MYSVEGNFGPLCTVGGCVGAASLLEAALGTIRRTVGDRLGDLGGRARVLDAVVVQDTAPLSLCIRPG